MRKTILYFCLSIMFLVASTVSVFANPSIVMRIPDIPGESVIPKYEDWIDVLAFSDGLSGDGKANKKTKNRIVVLKNIDRSSLPLRIKGYAGENLKNVLIVVLDDFGSNSLPRLQILLRQVTIESITTELDQQGIVQDFGIENIALKFKHIQLTYTPLNDNGSHGEDVVVEHKF